MKSGPRDPNIAARAGREPQNGHMDARAYRQGYAVQIHMLQGNGRSRIQLRETGRHTSYASNVRKGHEKRSEVGRAPNDMEHDYGGISACS